MFTESENYQKKKKKIVENWIIFKIDKMSLKWFKLI